MIPARETGPASVFDSVARTDNDNIVFDAIGITVVVVDTFTRPRNFNEVLLKNHLRVSTGVLNPDPARLGEDSISNVSAVMGEFVGPPAVIERVSQVLKLTTFEVTVEHAQVSTVFRVDSDHASDIRAKREDATLEDRIVTDSNVEYRG